MRVCLEFTAARKVPFDLMSDASEAVSGSSEGSEYFSLSLIFKRGGGGWERNLIPASFKILILITEFLSILHIKFNIVCFK